MTGRVLDQEIRDRAILSDESFIIQAPAGSGKTELLVQRYLRLLSTVDSPEEVIAITFTKKAAAEMRSRILRTIENIHESDDDELARKVHERDIALGWDLLKNPSRLRIQTVDALCASLTRQMPVLSGLGSQPETVENPQGIYLEAAENTLAELETGRGWSDAIAYLLTHLDNNLPRARDLLAGMLARRDQWLRHLVDLNDRVEFEDTLKDVITEALEEVKAVLPDSYRDDLITCISTAGKNMGWLQENLTDLPGTSASDLETWGHIADLCLTKENSWRKVVNVKTGFPADKQTKELKALFITILTTLSTDPVLTRTMVRVRYLPTATYTDREWKTIRALAQLLVLADAQLRLLFADTNQIDFAGVALASLSALGSDQQPTDLALHLDYQISHILVDEFQDISINQYLLLEKIIREWSVDSGKSVFLVGDPMQSIYRFREAEVGLFIRTWEARSLGGIPVTPLNIEMNFRSSASLVGCLNDIFKTSLPVKSDIKSGAVHFTTARAYSELESKDAVVYHATSSDEPFATAELVKQEIISARKKNPDGSIAILVRNRNHLQHILPELKTGGINVRAVEIEALGHRGVIQDLLALTRALCHPADRIAWLSILRSPWCGLSLEELHDLSAGKMDKTIWELLLQGSDLIFSAETTKRLSRFKDVLSRAFESKKHFSLAQWITSVWINLGGPASLVSHNDIENAMTYFDLVAGHERAGVIEDMDDFLDDVNKLYAALDTAQDDAVQVMTIHKSKGLEFDTVILAGLCGRGSSDDDALLMWLELQHAHGQDLILAGVKETGDENTPIYNYLKYLKQEKHEYENGRLMYVAMTRARSKLVLLGEFNCDADNEIKPPPANTLLASIWDAVHDRFIIRSRIEADNSSEEMNNLADEQHKLRRLTPSWQLPANPEDITWDITEQELNDLEYTSIEYEWAGEIIKHTGTVVHQYIQKIAEKGEAFWINLDPAHKNAHIYTSLKRQGIPEGEELLIACQRVEMSIDNILKSDKGQWILSDKYKNTENEFALSGLYRGQLTNIIIDRTFIDEHGHRWIIDYKSSRHDEPDLDDFLDQQQVRYRPQLEKYAAIMRNMESNPIKLGLYFPLLDGWREWLYSG